jgi:two-component system, chemotaxis family, sensor kinase Cph1
LSRAAFAFDDLFEHSDDPAFVLDPHEDRFVAANPAGCALLGYTFEELLETPISRIHPGELHQLQEFVDRVRRTGHGSTTTLTCRTRSATCLPTEMSLSLFDGDGRFYLLGLIRDRSEHRQRTRGVD